MPSQKNSNGNLFSFFWNCRTSKKTDILNINKTRRATCKFRTIQLEQLGVSEIFRFLWGYHNFCIILKNIFEMLHRLKPFK